MFENAQKFNIGSFVTNSVQGDYIVNNVGKDEKREIFELYSRLAQNFDNEPYYSSRHEQNLRRLTEGTCRWLLEDLAFLQWRDDPAIGQPVLWAHGSPGSGKSTLCSQAIRSLADSPKKPTVAYHFCDFSRQHKEVEILSMLACQLLDADSAAFADLPPLPISILSAAALQCKRADNVRNIVKHLVLRSPKEMVYFLLDGLDEELGQRGRWHDGICPVLQFLVQLAAEFPQHVRVWVSSQVRGEIKDQLSNFQSIDIVPFARSDIVLYLSKKVPELRGPTAADQRLFLQTLQDGAESSFIWARLMLEELGQRPTLSSMKEFIEAGFPRSLEDYYQKIFDRCPQHLRPLASMVFSLLVYAKRPLRFCELWEAVWCLSSKTKDVLNPDDKPYEDHLRDVFQPFIELVPIQSTEETSDELQFTCRIIHSTLKDFLVEHRSILRPDDFQFEEVHICPELAVKACLNYLLQSRFSDLLRKEGDQWHDISGTPVMNNRFLIYAAKYWDKHLDNVLDQDRQKELIPKVTAFVKSPNFWTVLQVQAIWVQAQFSSFHGAGEEGTKWLRRMLPWWFMKSDEGFRVWIQNRSFLRQWRYFLCCGICSGAAHTHTSPYTGEMDYIWTGALGPDHFLTERRSRVSSFAMTTEEAVVRGSCMFFTDLTSDSGSEVYALQIKYTNLPADAGDAPLSLSTVLLKVTLECKVQTWVLQNNTSPTLKNEQVLQVLASSCDFDLYVHDPSNPYAQTDRAPLAAFSSDGQVLRIGSKLFQRDSRGDFTPLPNIHSTNIVGGSRRTRYIEEVSRRGQFLTVTSRTRLSSKELDRNFDDLHDDSDDELDVQEWNSDEDAMDSWVIKDEDSDSDESGQEFASDDDSLSEGSSVFSNQGRFDDDMINPWADYHLGSSDGSDSEGGDDDGGGGSRWALGGGGLPVELDSSDSEEEEDSKEPPAFNRHLFREEDDEDWDGLPQYFSDQKTSRSKPRATIAVFDTTSGSSICVFRKQIPLRCKLYASPPAFHPSKPLVVWPLGDGDILFIDYEKSTSFTRRLRPSTPFTRQISIQCAFSSCGQYMHIAALEGRRPDPKTAVKAEKHKVALPPIHLALLASTYRLSSKKTARSPPYLIHRIRIDLRPVKSINTRQLPFNLTWTKDYLYIAASWKLLQVWRVPLFSDVEPSDLNKGDKTEAKCDDSQPVMAPEKTLFMPKTCTHRSVRFFPAIEGDAPISARIVVGHEVSVVDDQPKGPQSLVPLFGTHPAPEIDTQKPEKEPSAAPSLFFEFPVVCYLDEEKNLGEWVDSMSRTKITENLGIGALDIRMEGMEKFNPDDDCELEPYYY
ncbi:hypothetical protein MD484_g7364, partial [Candolleomyces efflorescens]